jgi:nitroreductase
VADCPRRILAIVDQAVVLTEDACLLCAHCYAVCPANAVAFDSDRLQAPTFRTFAPPEQVFDAQRIDATMLAGAALSRRSIRRFQDTPVSREALADLVEFAATAPSGSNSRNWEFSVVSTAAGVAAVRARLVAFYRRLNRLAGNPIVRALSVPVTGKRLLDYHRLRRVRIEFMVRQADAGRDLFFWGAPALIVVHSGPDGSTPLEDAQYAAYNITLLAHALGLGTCFIGYAREAVNRDARLKTLLGIPRRHKAHAVLAVGHPDVSYARLPLRKNFQVNWVEA